MATSGRTQTTPAQREVQHILAAEFGDRVYTVDKDVVWVSGMNEHCESIARRMAMVLTHGHDIPTSPVYDDDAVANGGVVFRWGDAA